MSQKMLQILSRMAIWGPGTFFCFPHKPLMCWMYQASYDRAYIHFRAGHKHRINLLAHLFALLLQLLTNFALLEVLGKRWIGGSVGSWLSAATAVLWIGTLCLATAPCGVQIMSAGSIAAAFAARHFVVQQWPKLILFHVAVQAPCAW
jgi:hypothetical protein